MRKGMMVGKGKKGYHNVIGKDPIVHSMSAKGIKQPQRVRHIPEPDYPYCNKGHRLVRMENGIFDCPICIKDMERIRAEARVRGTGKITGDSDDDSETSTLLTSSANNPSPYEEHQDIKEMQQALDGLNDFEEEEFNSGIASGLSGEKALEVIINNVEGDISQLSPALREYAVKSGLLVGFDYKEQLTDKEKKSSGEKLLEKLDSEQYGDYKIGDLRKIFKKNQNKDDWKRPVDTIVNTKEQAEKLSKAIIFFQGDKPKIEKITIPVRHKEGLVYMEGTAYKVVSKGYQG